MVVQVGHRNGLADLRRQPSSQGDQAQGVQSRILEGLVHRDRSSHLGDDLHKPLAQVAAGFLLDGHDLATKSEPIVDCRKRLPTRNFYPNGLGADGLRYGNDRPRGSDDDLRNSQLVDGPQGADVWHANQAAAAVLRPQLRPQRLGDGISTGAGDSARRGRKYRNAIVDLDENLADVNALTHVLQRLGQFRDREARRWKPW
mmetsp:Transcript_65880/g.190019  ORF Transcript_65880/g.190019 Transcript_65880/m.190019 type:complete len:201 (-) Transcript_65880:734-1336(-)